MTRLAPLALLAALVAAPFVAAAPAAAGGEAVCTDDLVEAVAACVGPGPCVTVFLGPSSTTRCAAVGDLGRVCTTDLVESVGVCENDEGCLALYAGPSERPLVCPASTAAAGGRCVSWSPWEACVEEGGRGEPCVAVWTGMPPEVVACAPPLP